MTPFQLAIQSVRRYPLLVGVPVGLAVGQALLTNVIYPHGPRSYMQFGFLMVAPFTASGVNTIVRNGVRRGPVKLGVFVANLTTHALPISVAIALFIGLYMVLGFLSGPLGARTGRDSGTLLMAILLALTHVWLAALVMENVPVNRTLAKGWSFLRDNAVQLAPLLLASLLICPATQAVLAGMAQEAEDVRRVLSGAAIATVTILLRTAVFHVADCRRKP